MHVTAAAGGVVEDKSGKAKLSIPPGALAQDTDITLALTAKTGNAVTDVADFGPDGLQFLKPVQLELKGDATLAPEGKSLAVAMETAGTFNALPGSTFANGVAKADVAHFTKFSIVVVDGKATLVVPTSCQDARAKFVACGGDPSGTWEFAEFCPDSSMIQDPTEGQCPQYTIGLDVTSTQVITITSSTVQSSAGTLTSHITSNFPKSCFTPDGGQAPACSVFADEEKGRACNDLGANCECTESNVDQSEGEPAKPYTISGNVWSNNDGSSGEYCVSGDLHFKEQAKEGNVGLLYVLKRKN